MLIQPTSLMLRLYFCFDKWFGSIFVLFNLFTHLYFSISNGWHIGQYFQVPDFFFVTIETADGEEIDFLEVLSTHNSHGLQVKMSGFY